MQKILDLTQDSLAGAFAALARSARRQQYLYFATIVTLTVIVVVSELLVAVLAAARHLDYRRAEVVQYAANVSLLLNREASFLRCAPAATTAAGLQLCRRKYRGVQLVGRANMRKPSVRVARGNVRT